MESQDVASRIRQIRAGMSLRKFASQLGAKPFAVDKWEKGDGLPSAPYLVRLADVGGVTVDWILCRVPAEHESPQLPEEKREDLTGAPSWALALIQEVRSLKACIAATSSSSVSGTQQTRSTANVQGSVSEAIELGERLLSSDLSRPGIDTCAI